jgi:hypothetical protein
MRLAGSILVCVVMTAGSVAWAENVVMVVNGADPARGERALKIRESMLTDWVIEWNTPYSSDPRKDKVTVTSYSTPPGCDFGTFILTPTSTGVTASVQPLAGGGYHHKIVWSNTLCVAGCSYDIQAESATTNQDGSTRASSALGRRGSTHVPLNVNVCIEEPGMVEL